MQVPGNAGYAWDEVYFVRLQPGRSRIETNQHESFGTMRRTLTFLARAERGFAVDSTAPTLI